MLRRVGHSLSTSNATRSSLVLYRSYNSPAKNEKQEKVVVLGTGWSSFRMIQTLKNKYKIILISPRNHFLFTPLLPSTTTGTLEFRSIVEPVRHSKIMDHISYYQAHCTEFDPERNVIKCVGEHTNSEFEVDYDKLVIGVGARNNTFGIPGVEEYGLFLKELNDARTIRSNLLKNFEKSLMPGLSKHERQRILSCVVVGGGPTGVEFTAELCDFLWKDLPKAYPDIKLNEVKITLLEAGENILSAFSSTLVKRALKNLKKQGADIRTDSSVKVVRDGEVELESGVIIPYGTLVWSTGIGPHDLIKNSPFELARSRIITDEYLKVKGYDNIYAFGDCASPENEILPATAQVALQQGKYLADAFNKMEQGGQISKFKYHFLGNMAYIGDYNSLLDTPHINLSGFVSWLAWRAAYFSRLGSLVNRAKVPFDWMKSYIFGRDVTIF